MLRPEKQLRIERFLRAVVQARKSLLVLDYDGTLAPLRAERNLAFPYPGVAQLLQEIACSGQTRVVIISGRDTGETISLLGFAPIPEVWGFDGLQRRKPDGSVETVRIEERYLDALSDATRWLGCQHLWHTAEFKTGSIAIDWRGFNEGGVEEVRSRVLAGWKPISEHSGLELLEFDGGLEIRVPGSDKGDAVRLVLSEMAPDTPAAYLGDDASDERAFRAIRGRGLSILVRTRRRQTAAQLWLKPPDELVEFLSQWLETVGGHGVGGGAAAAAVSG